MIRLNASCDVKVAAASAERIATWTTSETLQACIRYNSRTLRRRRLARSLTTPGWERGLERGRVSTLAVSAGAGLACETDSPLTRDPSPSSTPFAPDRASCPG